MTEHLSLADPAAGVLRRPVVAAKPDGDVAETGHGKVPLPCQRIDDVCVCQDAPPRRRCFQSALLAATDGMFCANRLRSCLLLQ